MNISTEDNLIDPKLKEECGVFGIYNHPAASELAYLGLYSLQHRGQESAGITTSDRQRLRTYKRMGLVSNVFKERIIKELVGDIAIGHVRYSTTGSSIQYNTQPFTVNCFRGNISIAHNGNLVNAHKIHHELEQEGAIFQTTLDSEIIVHLLARNKEQDLVKALIQCLRQVEGSYSLLVMNENKLIAARDPLGFRPLCIGKLGGSYIVASETCALDLINAEYVRDVAPGEMIVIDENGMESYEIDMTKKHKHCIFEYIYFARPDSKIFGASVQEIRKRLGVNLAKEHPVDADIVIPVPDSGNYAALGYANESGIPFDMGFVRNHYIGRTFIKPEQANRNFDVKVKLNLVKQIVRDKRVIIVDDSIVRATTTRIRVENLKAMGAKEIHLRISSPPITHSCFFGIDTPRRDHLIASHNSVEDIRKHLGVETLGYISIEGLLKSVADKHQYCLACFNGEYPLKISDDQDKYNLEINKQIDFNFTS